MLLGDLFLMLAILYPRVFADWSFFSLSSGYKAFGVLLSIFIWMAFFYQAFIVEKIQLFTHLQKKKILMKTREAKSIPSALKKVPKKHLLRFLQRSIRLGL